MTKHQGVHPQSRMRKHQGVHPHQSRIMQMMTRTLLATVLLAILLWRVRVQRATHPQPQSRIGERGAFNLANLKIGDVLLEVTNLVRTHQVQVDASFTTLVMAIVVLEGLGRELDPSLDLFSLALPILATL